MDGPSPPVPVEGSELAAAEQQEGQVTAGPPPVPVAPPDDVGGACNSCNSSMSYNVPQPPTVNMNMSMFQPPPPPPPLNFSHNNALVSPFGGGCLSALAPPPPLECHPALVMAQYYEGRMRDHAAAYANAAAGAAWAAAQIAAAAAEFAVAGTSNPLPPPPPPPSQQQQFSWNPNHASNLVMPNSMFMYHGSPPPPQYQPPSFVPPPHPQSQLQQLPLPASYGGNQHASAAPVYPPHPQVQPSEGYFEAGASTTAPPAYMTHHDHHHHNATSNEYYYDNAAYGPEQQDHNAYKQENYYNYPRKSRKKRQEHPPSDESSSIPRRVHIASNPSPNRSITANFNNNYNAQQQQQISQNQPPPPPPPSSLPFGGNTCGRGKVRRRLRSDGDSSSSGSSFLRHHQHTQQQQQQQQPFPLPQTNSSTTTTTTALTNKRDGSVRQNHHKKPRNSDISLLGKTAVSALYEWCGKRQLTPFLELDPVQDEFECVVRMMVIQENTTGSGTSILSFHNRSTDNAVTDKTDSDKSRTHNSTNHVLVELGRGRGRTKAAAKHDAARRAVQTLVPGVVFDNATGILLELPQNNSNTNISSAYLSPIPQQQYHPPEEQQLVERNSSAVAAAAAAAASSSLEDLAPNLAKLLAIGRDEDVVTNAPATNTSPTPKNHSAGAETKDATLLLAAAESKKRVKYQSIKRAMNVYPGTSTTSEEEQDENVYYASRGASVCSALLHVMVQIDPRIREPPEFTFQMVTQVLPSASTAAPSDSCFSSTLSSFQSPSQKAAVKMKTCESTAVVVNRGPFTCTATLRLHEASGDNKQLVEPEGPVTGVVDDNDDEVEEEEIEEVDVKPRACVVLKATAVGGTKKESRQMAAAQLLALLFPECETMVEVKAAAEAAREEYAASKALNRQQQVVPAGSVLHRHSSGMNERRSGVVNFAISRGNEDPPLPRTIKEEIELLVGQKRSNGPRNDGPEEEEVSEYDSLSVSALRQLSRKRQLDAQVELALEVLNERDEEGRSLPDELTDDDVGRIILRRALPEDLSRIKKLLLTETAQCQARPGSRSSELPEAVPFLASQLWSSSCIVLLLTRAIGAYEDPPLGCAILSLRFSMELGRLLHVTKLASETHLPKERFVECLEDFAGAMKCKLNVGGGHGQDKDEHLSTSDLKKILSSHLQPKVRQKSTRTFSNNEVDSAIKRMPLQSVQEESEVSEASSVDKRPTKRSNKPSKRSRFA